MCSKDREIRNYASSHLYKRNKEGKAKLIRLETCRKGLGNETGWREWGGDDAPLSTPFNIVSTLKNHVNVSYSEKEGNEDREKTKVDKQQKQVSLTAGVSHSFSPGATSASRLPSKATEYNVRTV